MENRLPRIAFVIDDLGFGGAQRQLATILPGFAGAAEPLVYCLSERVEPFAARITAAGVPVQTFRRRGHVDPVRLAALARRLRADEVDVVHGFLDASNVYASLAARRNRLPCVLSLRAQTHFLGGLRKRVLCHLLRRAERVTVNSRAGKQYLAEEVGVPPGRIVLVPNAAAARRPPSRTGEGPQTVGFVGRLVELKRVDLLIDAFARLATRRPDLRLVVVGDGPRRADLEIRAERLGVAGRIEWTGNVDDVESRIGTVDCLALPSRSEGFPNAAMEAVAAGVPVVASPAGDIADIVRDGETGYLLAQDSPDSLAAAIERVLDDRALRERVRKEGPDFIAERYPVRAAVETLARVYDELIRRG